MRACARAYVCVYVSSRTTSRACVTRFFSSSSSSECHSEFSRGFISRRCEMLASCWRHVCDDGIVNADTRLRTGEYVFVSLSRCLLRFSRPHLLSFLWTRMQINTRMRIATQVFEVRTRRGRCQSNTTRGALCVHLGVCVCVYIGRRAEGRPMCKHVSFARLLTRQGKLLGRIESEDAASERRDREKRVSESSS